MNDLQRDIKAMRHKHTVARNRTNDAVAGMIDAVRRAHAAARPDIDRALSTLASDVLCSSTGGKTTVKAVKGQHKVIHSAITRSVRSSIATFGTESARDSVALEERTTRQLPFSLSTCGSDRVLSTRPPPRDLTGTSITRASRGEVSAAVAEHLYRRGHIAEADTIVEREGLNRCHDGMGRGTFVAVHTILADMHEGNLHSAMEWTSVYSKALVALGSDAEFAVHSLRFLQLLNGVGIDEDYAPTAQLAATRYARETLSRVPTAHHHIADIRHLMGAVLFAGSLPTSPYAALVAQMQLKVEQTVIESHCLLHGVAEYDPLAACVNTSMITLPLLHKLDALSRMPGFSMQGAEELPFEPELRSELHFHSVFACPVSREETLPSNPPMLLRCGHVIGLSAVEALGGRHRGSFKCPTCPTTQTVGDAKRLFM